MTVEDLGAKYGKRLTVELADADVYYVHEVDDTGYVVAQWGRSAISRENAIENTRLIFETAGIPEAAEPTAEDAYLAVARTLPSAALKKALLERGDWNIDA